jgi:hypothetical protein
MGIVSRSELPASYVGRVRAALSPHLKSVNDRIHVPDDRPPQPCRPERERSSQRYVALSTREGLRPRRTAPPRFVTLSAHAFVPSLRSFPRAKRLRCVGSRLTITNRYRAAASVPSVPRTIDLRSVRIILGIPRVASHVRVQPDCLSRGLDSPSLPPTRVAGLRPTPPANHGAAIHPPRSNVRPTRFRYNSYDATVYSGQHNFCQQVMTHAQSR